MRSGSTAAALRQIQTLFGSGTVAGLTDRQLLERYLGRTGEGSELAFAALVARHGPMVLGVCRRALTNPGDADDAFQATFLILIRKARTVRVDDSLGRWLYGVSRKVAARARSVASRQPRSDPGALEAIEARPVDLDRSEAWLNLDEELGRLPPVYRSAIVLCDLGGLTQEEAARDLGCPVGTIKSRLTRGRARLRSSMELRGLNPTSRTLAPPVPIRLAESVVQCASMSGSTMAGMVPTSAVVLAEGMLKTMTMIKAKVAGVLILAVGFATTSAGVLARQDRGESKSMIPATDQQAVNPPDSTPPNNLWESDPLVRRLTDPLVHRLTQEMIQARSRRSQIHADPNDPKLRHANLRIEELQRALSDLKNVMKVLEPAPVEPPAQTRATLTAEGARANPPREFSKISLPDYVVEPPDIIVVEVLEALPGRPIAGERLVRPDGKVSLGFYGEISVSGLTLTQIKAKVVVHLQAFLNDEILGLSRVDPLTGETQKIDPTATTRIFVDVAAFNSKVYYVEGEVGVPGRLPITGNETVLDAINYAGGLSPNASRSDIHLVRPQRAPGATQVDYPIDLDSIINRGDTRTNYQILPGDRVIVGKSPDTPVKTPELEARMQTVERKLDEILKALERLPRP